MSSIEILENKISYIKEHLHRVQSLRTHTIEDIAHDHTIQSAVERELYLITQATIDLAEAFIAFKKYRKPTTMREAFDILAEEKVIDIDLAHQFYKIVGFRNALAHAYEDLKLEVLYDVLMHRLQDIERFLEHITF